MLTEARRVLASGLFDIGAVKFGEFRLKLHEKNPDAPLSPIYIDLRILRSFPDVLDAAVDVYSEMIKGLEFDLLADVPTAATPIVALLSHQTRVPMISPRHDVKSHGTGRTIDGVYKEGQTALLIDDLITRADSKIESARVLTENGLRVKDIAVLIDREQGGAQAVGEIGITCHVAFGLKELLGVFLEDNKISTEQYERTVRYLMGSAGG
jgi:orotate phosphoribosyltransferase